VSGLLHLEKIEERADYVDGKVRQKWEKSCAIPMASSSRQKCGVKSCRDKERRASHKSLGGSKEKKSD
jgi:hypothetical protein